MEKSLILLRSLASTFGAGIERKGQNEREETNCYYKHSDYKNATHEDIHRDTSNTHVECFRLIDSFAAQYIASAHTQRCSKYLRHVETSMKYSRFHV